MVLYHIWANDALLKSLFQAFLFFYFRLLKSKKNNNRRNRWRIKLLFLVAQSLCSWLLIFRSKNNIDGDMWVHRSLVRVSIIYHSYLSLNGETSPLRSVLEDRWIKWYFCSISTSPSLFLGQFFLVILVKL